MSFDGPLMVLIGKTVVGVSGDAAMIDSGEFSASGLTIAFDDGSAVVFEAEAGEGFVVRLED